MRWKEKLRNDFYALLKVGKEEAEVDDGCGIKKGDNLAPILIMIVVQLVVEEETVDLKQMTLK